MTQDEYTTQLDTAIMQLLRGEITSDQVKQLQRRIKNDPATLNYCADILAVAAGLETPCQEGEEQAVERLQAMLHAGPQAHHQHHSTIKPIFWRTVSGMAALILIAVGLFAVMQASRQQGLAQVINSLSAEWETPLEGKRLDQGARFLREGMVELKMASGAKVILQGPCHFSVDSASQLGLTQGRLTADVPQKAKGFLVQAPGVKIIDYGTRFGVMVEPGGAVETHVFQGRVEVQTSIAKELLQQGTAAQINPNLGTVTRQPARPDRFMQSLPSLQGRAVPGKWLDLADVVAGGNGYGTGSLGHGINLLTGETTQTQPVQPVTTAGPSYVMLFDMPYVDGVFVPNGPGTVVTSGNHHFAQCPKVMGHTYGAVLGGTVGQARLQGQVIGTAAHPAIVLFPNAGVTFSLDRVRDNHSGVTLTGFSALAGISESVGQKAAGSVEFWVLVDGQQRAHGQVDPDQTQVLEFEVPLGADDRFLTLMTTANARVDHCQAYFADPLLAWNVQ